MTQNDCFVFYIIATMLDGTTKVHSFKHLIGTKCSYKYVNMMGEVLDLSNFAERTIHSESSLDPTSGNVIHETTELLAANPTPKPTPQSCWLKFSKKDLSGTDFCADGTTCYKTAVGVNVGVCKPWVPPNNPKNQETCYKLYGGPKNPNECTNRCCQRSLGGKTSNDCYNKCMATLSPGARCDSNLNLSKLNLAPDQFCSKGLYCSQDNICKHITGDFGCKEDNPCCYDQYSCYTTSLKEQPSGCLNICCRYTYTTQKSCNDCKTGLCPTPTPT